LAKYQSTDIRFVGRDELMNAFLANCRETTELNNPIFFLHGLDGIGKSTFLEELNNTIQNDETNLISSRILPSIAFTASSDKILKKLQLQLQKKYSVHFKLFNFLHLAYLCKTETDYVIANKVQLIEDVLDMGENITDILQELKNLPVLGIPIRLIKLLVKGYKIYENASFKIEEQELYELAHADETKILQKLPEYFAKDLNIYLAENEKKAVIIFDNYDAMINSLKRNPVDESDKTDDEEWLFNKDYGLIRFLTNTTLILSGRDQILWMKDDEWHKIIVPKKLNDLPKEITLKYFEDNGVKEPEIRAIFEKATKGHPYYMNFAREQYTNEVKNGSSSDERIELFKKIKTPKHLEELFLKKLARSEKIILNHLSLCNYWNREIFEYLFKQMIEIDYLSWCNNRSYISSVDTLDINDPKKEYVIHTIMRDSLHSSFKDEYKKGEIHQKLFEYYKGKLISINNRFLDELDDRALWETYYHGSFTKEYRTESKDFFDWFCPIVDVFDKAGHWRMLVKIYELLINPSFANNFFEQNKCYFLGWLAYFCSNYHEWDKAKFYYEEALGIYRTLAETNPQTYLPNVAVVLNNLGALLFNLYEWDKAMEYYEESLRIRRTLAETNPQTYLMDVAGTLSNLGKLEEELKNIDRAKSFYKEALSTYEIINENNHLIFNDMIYWLKIKIATLF
jgi:hypothetical protein